MFIAQFRKMQGNDEARTQEPEMQKPTNSKEEEKSSNVEDFLKTPEVREFTKEWSSKTRDGKAIYTKRGITRLLTLLFPNYNSNRKTISAAAEVLNMLGGMDGLTGFLAGWKAKSEGLLKGIKGLLGG